MEQKAGVQKVQNYLQGFSGCNSRTGQKSRSCQVSFNKTTYKGFTAQLAVGQSKRSCFS